MLDVFDVESVGEHHYRGHHDAGDRAVIDGSQVLAQSIVAATKSVTGQGRAFRARDLRQRHRRRHPDRADGRSRARRTHRRDGARRRHPRRAREDGRADPPRRAPTRCRAPQPRRCPPTKGPDDAIVARHAARRTRAAPRRRRRRERPGVRRPARARRVAALHAGAGARRPRARVCSPTSPGTSRSRRRCSPTPGSAPRSRTDDLDRATHDHGRVPRAGVRRRVAAVPPRETQIGAGMSYTRGQIFRETGELHRVVHARSDDPRRRRARREDRRASAGRSRTGQAARRPTSTWVSSTWPCGPSRRVMPVYGL